MYLHLGGDTVVRTDSIIGIFDLDNASVSKATKRYLTAAQKGGRVVNVTMELPKTFVVCCEKGKTIVYIAQISSATLKKRTGFIEEISNVNLG